MSILDRISERIAGMADRIAVPARLAEKLARAEQHFARGELPEALILLDAVDEVQANIARSLRLRGLILRDMGRPADARRALLRACDVHETADARIVLGRLAVESGDHTSARGQLQRALELALSDEERLDALDAFATLHEELGEAPRAIPLLRQALRLKADDAALSLRLASALHADGDHTNAWFALAPALAAPEPAATALVLGASLAARVEEAGPVEAARLLDALETAEGATARVLRARADLARRAGDVDRARDLYVQALVKTTEDPERVPLLEHIAECQATCGDAVQARETLRQAIAIASEPRLEFALARAELETGEPRAALERLDGLEDSAAVDPRERQTLRGRIALALGDVNAARQALAPLRSASMAPEVLLALGELALAEGDPVEALGLLREASLHVDYRDRVEPRLQEALAALAPHLPDPGSVETITPARLAPFLDALAPVLASHPLLSSLLPTATALRQQLDAPLTVAVLGEFNAGKSTLINAFVAEDMLATGVLPTTSHVNVIRYGPRPAARWTREDGSVEELPFRDATTLVRERPDEIVGLEFCFPHPELRSIHFWDTPGFNAPVDEHEERAGIALERADAVIWLLDAHQALSASEFDRLKTIRNPRERLLVVVNKVDRLGRDTEEAITAIRTHLDSHLKGAYAGIHPLSALEALRTRTTALREGAADPGGDEHWQAFERAVRDRFFERAGRLKALEVGAAVARLAHQALAAAAAALDAVELAQADIREHRERIAARSARWETRALTPARDGLLHGLQRLRTRSAGEIADLVGRDGRLLARRRLSGEDRRLLIHQISERTALLYDEARLALRQDAQQSEAAVVEAIENAATAVGPPESRTLRRRLEAWLAEARALERLLEERIGRAPMERLGARLDALGDRALEDVAAAASRTEAERETALRQLLPDRDDLERDALLAWAEEYHAAAMRLSEHVLRDLDLLALDIDHRIVRPFRATADALQPLADESGDRSGDKSAPPGPPPPGQ